jgi:ribosomal protein S14
MTEEEYCPREWAFMDILGVKKRDSYVGTALRLTFDHGRSVEHSLRNSWLRDIAVGHWKCGVCGRQHGVFGKAPTSKCSCGYSSWEYAEVRFRSPISGVSGGIDVLLDVKEPKLRILEVKTIDKDQFKALVAPLAEHKFRVSLYCKLIDESSSEISSRVNAKSGTILYVAKSFGVKDVSFKEKGITDSPFSPFKEFVVTRDDSLTSIPVAKATVLHRWRVGGRVGMPCGICTTGLTKRAQKCCAVVPCFSGAHAATLTWMEKGVPRHPGKKVVG